MNITLLEPRKALNKAFLKIKPSRSLIENFKINLIGVLDAINEKETEEFHKNLVIHFLKKTYYDPNYSINTKGRNDLVIHNGKDAKSNVGVIIEAKSPINKSEMISVSNLNGKALQELILYYMRERITHKNTELKHLVVTNIYEWFIFDAQLFNKIFAENRSFTKQFVDFEEGRLSGKTTDFFYKEIAKPFIEVLQNNIEYAYFDIRKYEKPLRNSNKEDDKALVALFKLLSPEHLLKLSFINDNNTLDKNFYSELLHIIGLEEIKEGGKKLIQRHKEGCRNSGSLIENTIDQLDSLEKISRLQNIKQYGDSQPERLFNVALELTITWVNRILFLKLLEAQLISYHKGDKSYSFLNSNLIKDYDNLNSLFFQILARKPHERNSRISGDFLKVPYLNSSLFEPTELEHETFFVSQLEDNVTLPLLNSTVIKDSQGKKITGKKNPLDYFLSFLDAYDFASEGSEDIQEDNKTLINASVLGLIFEKINGYKDGSFFTPSFITMYMCKETIRRAVIQKFNETKNWKCNNFDELYNKIDNIREANSIINSIKVCDPAVGSGHFLVSALNEIIAIKNDLKVLQDYDGHRLKEYHFEVVNDELMVTDEDAIPFQYNPNSKESQRIQETLFHEKQTIIENCLFGVDINPNSVKICRLRLWIELLKNAYYKPNTNELETLPNIDINIKCGNSLISRFSLDTDLKEALKKSKLSIDVYKNAVNTYRNADSKEQKREMESLIAEIKTNFRSEINANDPKISKLYKLKGEHHILTSQTGLFELNKKEEAERSKKVKSVIDEIKKLDTEVEEIKSNRIYENAFEWRFEFPDILNDNGDFAGFDVVIGNPPYGANFDVSEKKYIQQNYKSYLYKFDSYVYFIEKGIDILKKDGHLEYITPILWLSLDNCFPIRSIVIDSNDLQRVFIHGEGVFEEAVVNTCSFLLQKKGPSESLELLRNNENFIFVKKEWLDPNNLKIDYKVSPITKNIIQKIKAKSVYLSEFGSIIQGITPYDSYKGHSKEIIKNRAFHFTYKKDDTCGKWLDGKNLNRYSITWDGNWLSYGSWLAAPRERKYFEGKRILFREVPGKGKKIQASIIEDEYFYGHSISPFKPNDNQINNLEYFLGIVNSNLISWFGNLTLSNFGKEVFPKLNPNDIKELPIPKNLEFQKEISKNVSMIIKLKSQNAKVDTSDLEIEIDQMIYKLYGLSNEEIAIVENS